MATVSSKNNEILSPNSLILSGDKCPEASPVIPKNAVLRNLTLKLKYCSTYLLFPAIFERTVEPEKFCLSVRKGVSTHFARSTRQYRPSTPTHHPGTQPRKLKDKYKYCSTYLLFPAIFERTVEPEKFCLSVRKERLNING